jgi:hypothetical protein
VGSAMVRWRERERGGCVREVDRVSLGSRSGAD